VTVVPIPGGVTAAAGFRAAGVAAGIKASGALDLALLVADRPPASAAALFTTNQVQAAPVVLCRDHLQRSGGRVAAVLVNSGCANACTGSDGMAVARASADLVAGELQVPVEQVLVASTGVIGVALALERIRAGLPSAAASLSGDGHPAARAIMTTDTGPKEYAVEAETPEGRFRVGGMAKGAGMIEPMMATMLAFVTTDAEVEPALLHDVLAEVADGTLNAITVDGDASTNDMVLALASGASGVRITATRHREALVAALTAVCRTLALMIVRGGEGATKLVAVRVTGAADRQAAKRAARTIANSLLVKTAVHGGDPNWGRLVAAAGRSGVPFRLEGASVEVGPVVLFRNGQPFDEAAPQAAEYLRGAEIALHVDMGTGGPGDATIWTCDLSAEYVRINGEYRT
jgi:glutamate N-acetyltransferase / amino-acid N-acetyltransferase